MNTNILKWSAVILVMPVIVVVFMPDMPFQISEREMETQKAPEYIAKREAVPVSQLVMDVVFQLTSSYTTFTARVRLLC